MAVRAEYGIFITLEYTFILVPNNVFTLRTFKILCGRSKCMILFTFIIFNTKFATLGTLSSY